MRWRMGIVGLASAIGLSVFPLRAPRACSLLERAARRDLLSFERALQRFHKREGRWPQRLEELFEVQDSRRPLHLLDPWGQGYVYLMPSGTGGRYCLFSMGSDEREGTMDDLFASCDLERLNKHRVLQAALHGQNDSEDVYGRPIKLVRTKSSLIAWSYGLDGLPDTQDDDTAVRTVRSDR